MHVSITRKQWLEEVCSLYQNRDSSMNFMQKNQGHLHTHMYAKYQGNNNEKVFSIKCCIQYLSILQVSCNGDKGIKLKG
jgi:hypothetical protein